MLVPGMEQLRTFYVRNQSGGAARLSVTVRVTQLQRPARAQQIPDGRAHQHGRYHRIRHTGRHKVAHLRMAKGKMVPVTVRVRLLPRAGNKTMDGHLPVRDAGPTHRQEEVGDPAHEQQARRSLPPPDVGTHPCRAQPRASCSRSARPARSPTGPTASTVSGTTFTAGTLDLQVNDLNTVDGVHDAEPRHDGPRQLHGGDARRQEQRQRAVEVHRATASDQLRRQEPGRQPRPPRSPGRGTRAPSPAMTCGGPRSWSPAAPLTAIGDPDSPPAASSPPGATETICVQVTLPAGAAQPVQGQDRRHLHVHGYLGPVVNLRLQRVTWWARQGLLTGGAVLGVVCILPDRRVGAVRAAAAGVPVGLDVADHQDGRPGDLPRMVAASAWRQGQVVSVPTGTGDA